MTTRRTFIAVHIFFAALATVFVGARFGAKWEKRLAWLLDDTLLLLALASCTMRDIPVYANSDAGLHVRPLCRGNSLHVAVPS